MSTPAKVVVHGHHGVLSQLDAINQWWPDSHQKVIAGINIHEVLSRLKALRESLVTHFAAEEKTGLLPGDYHGPVRFAEEGTRLLAEHGHLLCQLDSVIQHAPEMAGSVADWTLAHQAFGRFEQHLRAHEMAEADLLQNAFNEDAGDID